MMSNKYISSIENIKMRFGKYRGKKLSEMPLDYLIWGIKSNVFKGKVLLYAKWKTNQPLDKFSVTVTDSVGTDGTYIVDAYDKKMALNVCKNKYKIVNTQSYHGPGYLIEQINKIK